MSLYNALGDPHQANQNWSHTTGFNQSVYTNSTSVKEQPSRSAQLHSHILSSLLGAPSSSERYVPSQFQETQAAKKEEDGLPLDEPGMVIGREEVILTDSSPVVASGYHQSAIPNHQISSSHTHSANIHKTDQSPFLQGPSGLSTPQEFAGQPSQSVGSYGHDSYNSASHSQMQSSYVLPQNVNQQSHGTLQQNQNLGQQQGGLSQQTFGLQQHSHLQGQTQSHTQLQAVNQLPQHNQPGQQQTLMPHPLNHSQPLQQMANHQHYLGNQMNSTLSQSMGASQLSMGQPNQQLGGSPALLTQTVGQRPGVQHPLNQQQVANHQSSLRQLPVLQLNQVNYNILQRPLTLDDIIGEVPSSSHNVPLQGNNMHLLSGKNAYTVNRQQQLQQPMQLLIHRLPSVSLGTGQCLQNQQYLQNQMVVPNQQSLQGQRLKNPLSFSLLPHNARLQFQNQQPVHSQQSMPRQLSLPNHQSLQTQQTLQHQANFQNQHSVQSPATPHIEVGNQHQSFDSGAGYTGQLHGQATGVEQQQQQVACSQQPVKVKQEQTGMMFVAHPNTSVLGSPYVSSHHNSQHSQPQHLPQNVIQTSLGSPLAATLPNSPQLNSQTPSQCAMNSSPQLSVQQKSPQLSLQSSPQMSLQNSPQHLSLQGSPNTHQNSAQMMMMPSAQSKQQLSHQDAGQMGNLPQLNSASQAQTSQQAVQVQSANQASHNQNTPHTVQLSGNVLSQRPFQVSQQAEVNQQGRNQFTGQNSDPSVPSSGRGRGQGRGSRGGRGRGRGRGNANSATGLHMAPDHFRPDVRFPVAVESAAPNIEPVVSHAESSMAIQEPGLKELSAMPVPKSEPGTTALLQGSQLPCLNRYSPPSITYGTNETWPTPLPSIKQENCGSPPALIVNLAPQSNQLPSISPALSPASYLDDIKVSPPVHTPAAIPSATEVVPSPSQMQPAKPAVPEAAEEKPQPKPVPIKRKLAENEEGTAVCKYCGYCSSNLETCEGCRRVLPADVKLMIKKKKTDNSEPGDERERTCGGGKINSSPSVAGTSGNKRGLYGNKVQNQGAALMGTSYNSSGNLAGQSVGRGGYARRRGSGAGRGSSRARKVKEPVTVTISSDEDEDPSSDTSQRMSLSTIPPNAATQDEEEGFFSSPSFRPEAFGTGRRERMQEALGKYAGEGIYFKVRGVRIGNMRTSGIEVRFRDQSIAFKVMSDTLNQELQFTLLPTDLTLIKFFLRLPQPVIFIKVTPECAQRLRELLKMTLETPETFDPTCQDDKKNMIVVIIEVVYNEPGLVKVMKGYNQVQNLSDLLHELDFDASNDLLVKSAPVTGDSNQKCYHKYRNMSAQPVNDKGDYNAGEDNSPASIGGDVNNDGGDNSLNHQDGHSPSSPRQGAGPNDKLLIYPPFQTKGYMTIRNQDLFCLNESEFLNDVILDFYLKYLFLEKLSEADQARTYIFSSFFYKRMTQREPNITAEKLSPAQKRHNRVKTWTRHVDIFEKDFLLIPINEKAHWMLAVVCFPGMVAQEQYNYQVASPTTSEDMGQSGDAPTTSRRSKTQGSAEEEESQDSLPEATATCAKSEATSALGRVLSPEEVKKEKSVVNVGLKQACILVMDSLSGTPRTNIIRTLKDYLQVEWDLKKTPERDMLKTVRGCCPKVPQQNNFSDCGLFVLQYAESFFENPIANFSIPMKLKDWFPLSRVERKREDIRSLILRLHAEYSR